MSNLKDDVEECFKILSQEARELYLRESVVELGPPVSPLQFLRDYVGPNMPVLVKGAVKHWPAISKWGPRYFREALGWKPVTVAVTPDGYADAVAGMSDEQYFVMPEERTMTMEQFLDALDDGGKYPGVHYIQRQNSNLTQDFPELLSDCEPHIPWASDAFGSLPDAVNLWVGDARAVTSMHKDPYENIYCVVSGRKDFILLPPTDRPWIPYKIFRTAVYKETSGGCFDIVPTSQCASEESMESYVPWICVDPLRPDLERYPLYRNASPVEVSVEAGDALYLPSLWYHHVRQSHCCIAVNYWYNMQFDVKYAYHQMLEVLTSKCLRT